MDDPFITDAELLAELDRRDAAIEAGQEIPIPFDQAMWEIRESLKSIDATDEIRRHEP